MAANSNHNPGLQSLPVQPISSGEKRPVYDVSWDVYSAREIDRLPGQDHLQLQQSYSKTNLAGTSEPQ